MKQKEKKTLNFGTKIWLVSGRSNSIEIKKDMIDTNIYISIDTEIITHNERRKQK